MLGDIIAIRDESGDIVARYVYDAWGNHTVHNEYGGIDYSSTSIGHINPFRYRGYYYDVETGFYYLQTRYYDPTICRFINADNYELVAELSQTVGQLNLYAYANNNPVMLTDETGEGILLALIGILASGAINGVVALMTKNETESAWGAFAGGFVTGAVSAIGLAAGLATGGITGTALALLGGWSGGVLGNVTSQKISYGNVDMNVAYLNGGINAITTVVSYLALIGLYPGVSWIGRFIDAASISEIGIGLSVFFATQNLPNLNDYRGKLNYFGW